MQLKCKSCLQVVGNIVKTFTSLYWEDGFEHCFLFYVPHIFDISPESNATSTERAWENEQFPANSKNDDDFCFKSERNTNQKKAMEKLHGSTVQRSWFLITMYESRKEMHLKCNFREYFCHIYFGFDAEKLKSSLHHTHLFQRNSCYICSSVSKTSESTEENLIETTAWNVLLNLLYVTHSLLSKVSPSWIYIH